MSGGTKDADEFRKLWDKGKNNSTKLSTIIMFKYQYFLLFFAGLRAQCADPNNNPGMALKCVAVRHQFEIACATNPQFEQKVLENPDVKRAIDSLGKSINQLERYSQKK